MPKYRLTLDVEYNDDTDITPVQFHNWVAYVGQKVLDDNLLLPVEQNATVEPRIVNADFTVALVP